MSIFVKHNAIKTTHLYERFEGTGLPDELRDRFDFDLELDLHKYRLTEMYTAATRFSSYETHFLTTIQSFV
jgi:hypothetical protein